MKVRKLNEANELEKRSKHHKKNNKGCSPYCTLNTDAGNVEHNVAMFNKMNSTEGGPSTNPNGPMAESLPDIYIYSGKEYVELHYDDLEIEIVIKPGRGPSLYFEYGRDEAETKEIRISYDYEVPKEKIVEYIYETATENDFGEIYDTATDDELFSFVESNFEKLFDKYESMILDYYREDAKEEAETERYNEMNESFQMKESLSYESEQFLIELGQTQDEEIYQLYLSKVVDKNTDSELAQLNKSYNRYAKVQDDVKLEKIANKVKALLASCADRTTNESLSDRIRRNELDYDAEVDAYTATEGDVQVQFQDRETQTHEFRTSKNRYGRDYVSGQYNKQPKVSSNTWARVWKNGKLVKQMEGPKYKVRADMAKYLDNPDVLEEDWTPPEDWVSYRGAWIYPVNDGYEANFMGSHFQASTMDELKKKLQSARVHRNRFSGYAEKDAEFANNIKKFGRELVDSWSPELVDCPACGDTSFDSRRGRCTKCSYREALDEFSDELDHPDQEFDSAKTSINSAKLPAVYRMINIPQGTTGVDFGGGSFDNAVEHIRDLGATLCVYDPYNRSASHNSEVIKTLKSNGGADWAINSNVLNVIKEPEARKAVLKNISRITKSGAPIYITVYEGRGDGQEGATKSGYQLNRKTQDYLAEIQEVFPDAVRKGKLITAHNVPASVNESNNAYSYKNCTIIDVGSGWKVKNASQKWIGSEFATDKDAEEFVDSMNESFLDDASEYEYVSSKSVLDSDGFYTDYTWYRRDDGMNVFVFGDNELYTPQDGYFDHEEESDEVAQAWFDSYNGFEEDIVDESLNEGRDFDKVQKRIARVGEFDNGYVMHRDWKVMSIDDSEELARKKSIENPDDIFYVQYDDIMNPSSDFKWKNGKKLNDSLEETVNSAAYDDKKNIPLYIIRDSHGNQLSAPNSDDEELWDRVASMEARGRRGLCVVVYNPKKECFKEDYNVKFYQVFKAPTKPDENGEMIGQRGTLSAAIDFGEDRCGAGNFIIKGVCDDGRTRYVDFSRKERGYVSQEKYEEDFKSKRFTDKEEAKKFAREHKGYTETTTDDKMNSTHHVFYKESLENDGPVYVASSIDSLNNYCAGLGDTCKNLRDGNMCSYRGYEVEFVDGEYNVYLLESIDESKIPDDVLTESRKLKVGDPVHHVDDSPKSRGYISKIKGSTAIVSTQDGSSVEVPLDKLELDIDESIKGSAENKPLYVIKDSHGNQLSAPNPDDEELWDRVASMEARGRRGLCVVAYTVKKDSLKEWNEFSDDDVEDDLTHSAVYGGDSKYCKECGAVKKYDEDGFAYCPECCGELDESYWYNDPELRQKQDELISELESNGFKETDGHSHGTKHWTFFLKRVDGKGVWKAIFVDTASKEVKIIDVTYGQVCGYEPLDSFDALRKNLGKKLLP